MKIFILGCGYLGYNINLFLKNKYDCEIIGLKSYYSEKCDNFKEIDIFNTDDLDNLEFKDSIIIDCISLISNTEKDYSKLDLLTKKYIELFNYLETKNIKRYVMLSSGGTIYGNSYKAIHENHKLNPLTVYAKSKFILEEMIIKSDLNYLILRPTNPYGGEFEPNKLQGVINILVLKALKKEVFSMYNDANTIRDYIYIEDFARAIYLLIKNDINNEIVNISSKEGKSLQEVINLVENYTNEKIIIEKINIDIPIIKSIVLSNEKLIKLTGYKPSISFEKGIALEVERVKKELKI